jgi:hypothetical protein
MMVPDELPLQFRRLDVAIVHLANDPGAPMIGKKTEFFAKINRFHCGTYKA